MAPGELHDAVLVDGCELPDALRLIIVPLLVAGALCFALSWNEFFYRSCNGNRLMRWLTL